MAKAIPGLVAELDENCFSVNHSDDGDMSVGGWYQNGRKELVHVPEDNDDPIPSDDIAVDVPIVYSESCWLYIS